MPPSKRRAEDMSDGLMAVAAAAEQAEMIEHKSAFEELQEETVYDEYVAVLRNEYLQSDMESSSNFIYMLASALLLWTARARLGFVMRFIRSSAVGRDAKMNMNRALLSFGPRGGHKSNDRLLAEHVFRLERIRAGFGHYTYSHHHWNKYERKVMRRPRTTLEFANFLLKLHNMGATHHHETKTVIVRACERLKILVTQAWALTADQRRAREGESFNSTIAEACTEAIQALREIVTFEDEVSSASARCRTEPSTNTNTSSSNLIPTELAIAIARALQTTHGLNLLAAAAFRT